MGEISAGVRLSLKDQFSSGIKGAGQSVKDFGSTALGAVDKVNKALSGLAGTLATVGVTVGIGAAVKTYIDLDDRIVRIGTNIGATARETNELKRSLYAVATDPSIKMGTDSLLTAMETFSGKGFKTEDIMDNLRDVGVIMKATGISGGEAADFFIESFKKGMSKEEIVKSLNDMSVIGDQLQNQYSLSDFTKALPGLEAVNSLLGKSAMNTAELYTAMNVLGAGTKSPARAVSAYTAIVNELADPRKQAALRRMKVNVRDEVSGQFRNLADILSEIAATDEGTGNFDHLSTVFSGAAMDAVFAYHKFGKLADGLENLGDTTGVLEQKARNNAESLRSNLTNLQTAFMSIADQQLTAPLEKLTGLLNVLAEKPEMVEKGIKTITGALVGLAAVKIGAGVLSILVNAKLFKSGGKINVSGLGGGGAGIPVHVTNWGGVPGSAVPGYGPMQSTGVPGLDPRANNAALAKGAAVKAGIVTAAFVGVQQGFSAYQQIKAINADTGMSIREKEKAKGGVTGGAIGTTVGTGAGAIAGALLAGKIGAAVGTAIAPGVGTLIGAGVGMLGGFLVGKIGKKVGEGIGDIAGEMAERKALRDEINSVPALPIQTPASAVLEGNASMDVNVKIHEDRTEASVFMRHNTMPIHLDTGLVWDARGIHL